jgi:cytochrome c oxidase cbb3-type subunit 3
MLPFIYKRSGNIIRLPGIMLFLTIAPSARAGGTAGSSIFSNPLEITLIILMILLLIIIAVLANILLGTADLKWKKRKNNNPIVKSLLMIGFLFACPSLFAQNATADATQATDTTIGGLSSFAFYVMATVIFLELFIILALLVNIKFLISTEKEKIAVAPEPEKIKVPQLSWWDKFNKLRPVSQEAELDLGHDYDGIRELNNRLPPWWLYGFYLTIIVAVVYLWRYHVSHDAPLSIQEYETSVQVADVQIKEYLKKKGDNVDETNVVLLTGAEDVQAGKAIFTDPSRCMTCHGPQGGGNSVGPNLTDDYWIYGGNIKDLFKTIKYGTNKGMRSWKDDLSAKQIAQVASYVKSLHGSNPVNPKPPQGELYKEEPAPATAVADSIKAKVK